MKTKPLKDKKSGPSFFRSIQAKIFLAYGSIFLFLILVVASVYYFTSYQNFLHNLGHTSRQLSKIVSNQLTQYIGSVNSIQKRILESDDILNYIFVEAPERDVRAERNFRQNIYGITGYDFDFYHMNIYNLEENTLLTFGQSYDYQEYDLSPSLYQSLVEPVLAKNGAKYLTSLQEPVLFAPLEKRDTISMLRSFGRYLLTQPKAVIEIQMSYERIQKLVSDTVLSYGNTQEQVLLFDDRGGLIYPQNFPFEELSYYQSLDTSEENLFKNPHTGQREMVVSHFSKDTGFSTFLITPESYLDQNKAFYLKISLEICLFSMLLLLALSFRIAKGISSPLAALAKRISALELSSVSQETPPLPPSFKRYNEVEVLHESYDRMEQRLKNSLDEIVASKTLTMHAQLMALQAQMDSHFLYNTLTIISIIAEDNDDYEASSMCVKLTEMLRYLSVDFSEAATLEQELHHTRNYTDLMTIRFGSNIHFLYETEDSLLPLKIPRLLIQPIVENSVKYSRSDKRTLEISIHIFARDGYWQAVIMDNGDGFSQEALTEIQKRIDGLNNETTHPVLSIDGLGLANIYLRLKLFYSQNFLFRLENRMEGEQISGAIITIGGLYHDSRKENPDSDCRG